MPTAPALPADLASRYSSLLSSLRARLAEGLLVAFSGGVDSAFLLWTAEQARREYGGRLVALTTASASLAEIERTDATRFAETLGVDHRWVDSAELSNPAYVRNDATRCYHCKTELFRICHDLSSQLGLRFVAYGYNASDRGDFRPGHKAAGENGVLSPLDEASLTKEDIRALMRGFDLPLAEKPSSPCLSSRLMQGVAVTPKKLKDVEEIEAILRRSGLATFRVRLHEEGSYRFLRLEVAPAEMAAALAARQELTEAAQTRGYRWITLDLAGYRSGGASIHPSQP